MNVTITVIPHASQRYPTAGDWVFDKGGNLHIRVSELGDWRQEMLTAFHELAEVLICKHRNISQEAVDQFDMNYELARTKGDTSEPGDCSSAPYYDAHQFATCVERLLARELDVNFQEYDAAVKALDKES